MKKAVKIFLFSILGLLILILAIGGIGAALMPGSASYSRKENIDSLIAVVKKDSAYRIKAVSYSKNDSSFTVIVKDKDGMGASYFNTEYHIGDFKSIEEIRVCDIHNKELSSLSKKGARLVDAFKEKYCYGNTCTPMEAKIKESMNDPDSYESDRLGVEWNGDSLVVVTCQFRGKNAFGAKILNRVQGNVDMAGNVTDFKFIQ